MANKKLTKREKMLLYLLFCLVIITGILFFFILPAMSRNVELSGQIDGIEIQLQEMQIMKDGLSDSLSSAADLEEKTNALYENLFTNDITDEALDVFVTQIALDAGISPQNLTINTPEFRGVGTYMGSTDTTDDTAAEQEDSQVGSLVFNLLVNGECSYSSFVKLVDAYQSKPQLLIGAATFLQGSTAESAGTFSISLDVYTLPPHGTSVAYITEEE